MDLNKGSPVMEGIQGGTATDTRSQRNWPLYTRYIIAVLLHIKHIQIFTFFYVDCLLRGLTLANLAVCGNTVMLLEQPDNDQVNALD